jgi:hypothetical protein
MTAEVYELVHPITQKRRVSGSQETTEETVTFVELRRINGGDVRWLEAMDNKPGKALGLLGRLTGWTPTQIDQLDAEDIAGMSEIIAGFLPDSLPTGGTSSAI